VESLLPPQSRKAEEGGKEDVKNLSSLSEATEERGYNE
jgi:hypothetical protein